MRRSRKEMLYIQAQAHIKTHNEIHQRHADEMLKVKKKSPFIIEKIIKRKDGKKM